MKIVINNTEFGYDIGCRLLKTKYRNTPFKGLEDIWNDITPITFKEISKLIRNIEQRRVAIGCLGLENIVKEVNPKLVKKETLKKTTTWVSQSGELIKKEFNDTYELYEVEGKDWSDGVSSSSWRTTPSVYFIKCKDTSTDREYMIWVDARSVYQTNTTKNEWLNDNEFVRRITPIQSIAWTIQTNVPLGGIEKIVRQGDCILIKKKKNVKLGEERHLTEQEYKTLLELES